MQIKHKALRRFSRTLISSVNTGELEQLDSSLVNGVLEQVSSDVDSDDALVISFVDQQCWMLVTLNCIFWCSKEGVNQLEIDTLVNSKLDLLTNKKMGFNSKIGFNILSLETNKGETINIKIEGGSALEASMALINELIAAR